jgi:hypothetical protein
LRGEFLPYCVAQWFCSTTNGAKFCVESERTERFLHKFRLTFYADDRDGILPRQLFSVLELVPDFQMTMLELAFTDVVSELLDTSDPSMQPTGPAGWRDLRAATRGLGPRRRHGSRETGRVAGEKLQEPKTPNATRAMAISPRLGFAGYVGTGLESSEKRV